MVNNEKEKGNRKRSIKLRRLKLVQHCIQLTIAKSEKFFKRVTFFGLCMFVNSSVLHKSCEIYTTNKISQINLSDSSATQLVFNLKVNPSLKESSLDF